MTYQDDPNLNRPTNRPIAEPSYTGWIIGGVAAFALMLGLFAMFGRDNTTNTAANPTRPATTAPATTGSGAAVPAPGSGEGTAVAPRQTLPPAPAR